jgi:hypothetical protein
LARQTDPHENKVEDDPKEKEDIQKQTEDI